MARTPIQTWCFALVVVRHEGKFLLIQERKHGQRWYLPAGRVEPGETFVDAAVRETREEAGIDVVITGIVRVEHTPMEDFSARWRVVFVGKPAPGTDTRNIGGRDSLAAEWVTAEELDRLSLRGPEVKELFQFVAGGGPIYPVDLITFEHEPYRTSRS